MRTPHLAPTYQIVHPTSHYTIRDRWVCRDTWVRLGTGELQLWSLPESPLGGAA